LAHHAQRYSLRAPSQPRIPWYMRRKGRLCSSKAAKYLAISHQTLWEAVETWAAGPSMMILELACGMPDVVYIRGCVEDILHPGMFVFLTTNQSTGWVSVCQAKELHATYFTYAWNLQRSLHSIGALRCLDTARYRNDRLRPTGLTSLHAYAQHTRCCIFGSKRRCSDVEKTMQSHVPCNA
jgi:hypothetical protein